MIMIMQQLSTSQYRARATAAALLLVGLSVLSLSLPSHPPSSPTSLSNAAASSHPPRSISTPSAAGPAAFPSAARLGGEPRRKMTGTIRAEIHGTPGFNNQRQVLMVHTWAARELGLDLLLPTHFNQVVSHSTPALSLEGVYDMNGIRDYLGGDVGFYNPESTRVEAKADVDVNAEVVTISVEVNSNCLGGLSGDALRAAVDRAIVNYNAASSGGGSNNEKPQKVRRRATRYNVELSKFKWEMIDGAFPDDENGRRDAHELVTAFRLAEDTSTCADIAVDQVLSARCPGGIHATHLRVGDRNPRPLFDCTRGGEVLGRQLREKNGLSGTCIDAATNEEVTMGDVLAADLPPTKNGRGVKGKLESDQCVYVATNGPKSDEMEKFLSWAETEGRGAKVLTYQDVVLDSEAMSECRRGGRRAIVDPSLFEQALMTRINGRFVSSYPSSWDSYVLHTRLDREETTGEMMFMAREDLAVFREKNKATVKADGRRRDGTWCFKSPVATSLSRGE